MGEASLMSAQQKVGLFNTFFPILPLLGNHWATSRPFEGHTIGLNLHLTTLTVGLVRELALGGGRFVINGANPKTTDPGSVSLLRQLGFTVFNEEDAREGHRQLLDENPTILADSGFGLLDTLIRDRPHLIPTIKGVVETSRAGMRKLRASEFDGFPVININDGRLKNAVENQHGVGEGLWQAVGLLTGMHLAGRRAVIFGYGPVGRGVAAYARACGLAVEIVESDPVRRLFAHYDGFPNPSPEEALKRAQIAVTATGGTRIITPKLLSGCRDGLILVNAGHGNEEIAVQELREAADGAEIIGKEVVRYTLNNGSKVTLLGEGHPLNIVMNSGSPEPVLLHFSVLGLALQWLAGANELPGGEIVAPEHVENTAARFALKALQHHGE